MPNQVIDLRKLRRELKGDIDPGHELPAPAEEELLETETAAHPEGFPAGEQPSRLLSEWQALEFEPSPERNLIQFALGGALAIGAIVAFFFASTLLGIFLVLAGAIVASYAFREPRYISFAVTSRGVKIGARIYEFRDLKSFWIFYEPPLSKELAIESKKTFMPFVRIPLGDQDPLRIREILLRFLPEVEREDSLLDVISKHLGF